MNATRDRDWVAVSSAPLRADELVAWATRPECGAVVTFCGTARTTSTGDHEIVELEYETSVTLAKTRMSEIVASARSRWPPLVAVAMHHRIGTVRLEEAAVVVVVSAPHRTEAFEAAEYCIDTLKRSVPMWKREVWSGGSAWSEVAHDLLPVEGQ